MITNSAQQTLSSKILHFKTLEDEWLNGDGGSFNKADLDTLADLLSSANNRILDGAYVRPSQNGVVLIEANTGNWYVSLAINLKTMLGSYTAYNHKSKRELAQVFPFKQKPKISVEQLSTNLNSLLNMKN